MTEFTTEQMLDRAARIDEIVAKWKSNPGYADTYRMEAEALRFMATHHCEGSPAAADLARKHRDFQKAAARALVTEVCEPGHGPKLVFSFKSVSAERSFYDVFLRFSLHGIQLPAPTAERSC